MLLIVIAAMGVPAVVAADADPCAGDPAAMEGKSCPTSPDCIGPAACRAGSCVDAQGSCPLKPGYEVFPPAVPATFAAAKTLFDPVGFHQVDLVVDAADWAAYLAEGTRKLHGGTSIAATVSIGGTAYGRIGIRPFGFGSRNHNDNKPNIRMSFDEYQSSNRGPQGVHVLRLKASGQDPSWLRQPLSQALVQAAGGFAPRFSWARVNVNGEPYGIYQLFEQVDKRMFERNFGNSDGHNYERRKSCFGLNCPLGVCADLASRYVGKGDGSEMARLAQTAHTGAPTWFEDASRIADMDSLLAQYAVEVWASDIDSLAAAGQNYEVYVNKQTGLIEFIPVGMDKGFGTWRNDAWYELATPWGAPNSWCPGRVDEFYARIWNTPRAKAALLGRIKALHCGPMSNAVLLPLIDGYQALLHDDLYSDPKGNVKPAAIDAAYRQLKDYVSRRNVYLDDAVGTCP
jgi:hypothetical protein